MKGLVCKICGYVALDGNKQQCPVCNAKNVFEEKEEAYKNPDFKTDSGESEKKHIPAFTVVNECCLISNSGCTDDVNPAAVIHLKSGTKGKVQVIENCNVHGKWYNEVRI